MDDRRALMAAILADPAEDTPRLALADWLDEHGDAHDRARAAFIRLQCELGRLPKWAKKTPAHKRAKALHTKHVRAWLGPLAPLNSMHEFNRGLLEHWYCTAGAFLKKDHQRALAERLPLVGAHTLLLTGRTARPGAVAGSAALEWFAELCWLGGKLDDAGLRELARSPCGARLSRVLVTDLRCTNAGLAALAKSAAFPNLRTVGLRAGSPRVAYTHRGVLRVLESARFPRLESLDLLDRLPAGFDQPAFYNEPVLSRVRVLWAPSGGDTSALCRCRRLTNLESLRISSSTVTDDDARALLDNPAFARLKVLELWNNKTAGPQLSEGVTEQLRERFGENLSVRW
ncbi:TIGR02996 domain-containing protein [Gemmata sp.]|uniref:TIGR02996 domain-containing protein n=1 Tax=Gemmata sp. TaxID=1914242 RepID=UPI003F716C0A